MCYPLLAVANIYVKTCAWWYLRSSL